MKVEERRRLKKIAIMEAAMDAWSCDDYKKTSLTSLAKELQMTKPALYRYFSSKEELLDSMAEYVNALELEWFLELIPRLKETPQKGRIRLFVESYSRVQVEGKRYIHFNSFNTLRQNKLFQFSNKQQILEVQKILAIPDRVYLLIMLYCFFMWGWHENEDLQHNRSDKEKIDLILYLLEKGMAGEEFKLPVPPKGENTIAENTREIYKQFKDCNNYDALTQAVNEVIQERGFLGVTLELIAEKAGISKSTLYNYFENKDEMLTKTINVLVSNFTRYHARILETKKSFEEKLLTHLELLSVLFPQKPQAFIVLKQFMSPEIFGKIERPALHEGFLDFLQEGINKRKLKNVLTVYEYQIVFSFFIFIERVIYKQEGETPLTEEILEWLQILAYGYRAEKK